jgi:hypothetical protein
MTAMLAPAPTDRLAPRRLRGWLVSLRPVRRWLIPVMGAAGLGLLAIMIAELGPAQIAAQLKGLGDVLPAVMLLTALKYPLQAAGWRLTLPREQRPSWWASTSATLTGDSLGYLTWAGPFTGEPVRAMLMRDTVPVAAGIAAGAIERTLYNLTAALLVWLVLVPVLTAGHPLARAAAAAVTIAAAFVLVRRIRRAPWSGNASADAASPRPTASPASEPTEPLDAASVWRAARRLWHERRSVLPAIALLCVAQHAVLVGEAYLLINALGGGTTLRTVLLFEAVTKIVNTAGVVVPARIGVAEGGSAVLADALGFAASQGLSLALMRRIRAMLWACVGLALLPFQEARARR